MVLSACAHSPTPLPATAGASTASAARPRAQGAIVSWALFASDFCPSKKENVALAFVALDASGSIIHGSYGTTVKLTDTDKSGATKLSRTTIADSAQSIVTLSYSGKKIAPFYVNIFIGKSTAFTTFSPYDPCVNHLPLVLELHLSGKGTKVRVKGAGGAGAPYFMTSSGDYANACDSRVAVTQISPLLGQFVIAPNTSSPGVCQVKATATGAKEKEYNHGLAVVLVK